MKIVGTIGRTLKPKSTFRLNHVMCGDHVTSDNAFAQHLALVVEPRDSERVIKRRPTASVPFGKAGQHPSDRPRRPPATRSSIYYCCRLITDCDVGMRTRRFGAEHFIAADAAHSLRAALHRPSANDASALLSCDLVGDSGKN
jgi:hypothetical protein